MVNLTIGGGASKGFAFLGALEYLYKNNLLNNIKNFYGTSVGSILIILYIVGYKPFEIFEELLELDFSQFNSLDIEHLQTKYSLLTNAVFLKINKIFSKKENVDITIQEFNKKYEVNINIYATSLQSRQCINLNEENFAKVKILTALQASCSIPILFPPVNINGELYIDGCLKNIDGINNSEGYIIKSNNNYKKINNFSDYLLQLLNCTLQNCQEINTKKTICIDLDNVILKSKLNFLDIENSDKIILFYEGLAQTEKTIKNI